ncbi:MAG: uroporphyrinogen decarboxylase family protein [Rikenellaceae bacterium]
MNMKQWAQDVITSPKRLAIPVMTHPGIEMIGKRVEDAVKCGEVHAQAIIALNEKFPADGATVIMDLTVEAEAFGAHVEFEPDDIPNVIGRLVSSYEEVAALEIPDMSAARIPEYLEANRIVAQTITDKPTFAGCIGPFSLAGRLYDMTEIMMAIYTEPESAELLLGKCTEFLKRYIGAIKSTGVSGVMIAEPAAGLLSNEDATNYSSRYIREIVEELQDDEFMIILHNCGNTGHCTESMISTGAAALHFGNKINMVEALKESPSEIIVMGNLDPVEIFKQADSETVAAATEALLSETKEFKNFIISTGCDTPPGIPEANIEAFYSKLN